MMMSKTVAVIVANNKLITMHVILAFDDTGLATFGAVVILALSVMALIRSKMPS